MNSITDTAVSGGATPELHPQLSGDASTTGAGSRKAARRLGERGVAAVETALMVPLLFFLFFGMIEFGLYWQADHKINESARAGARLGATLARELGYQDTIVEAVEGTVTNALANGEISFLTIYRADPTTGDPFDGTVLDCTVNCYRYTWDANTETFTNVAGPEWSAADQKACGEVGHNDYLGVYVEGSYQSLTGVLLGDRTIRESSIIRLEPVPLSNTCEPSS